MDSDMGASFGETLKAFRQRKKMTQQQLAFRLSVHRNTIGSWERGDYLPDGRGLVLELAKHLRLNEQESRSLLEASLTTLAPYWCVPMPRNPFFTGREALLEQLHVRLGAGETVALTQSYALSGLGGIGKTQVALEYAYRHSLEYSAVFWLAAETAASLMTSLQQIASQLHLAEQRAQEQDQVVKAVQHWLATHSRWLLIGDNVEDLDLLQGILPPSRQGALLLTTRHQALGALAEPLELPPLSSEEGVTLVLRRARRLGVPTPGAVLPPEKRQQEQLAVLAASELVQLLEGLPLALDQAGAYLDETGCTVADYLLRYQDHRQQVLARRGASDQAHPASVATTLWLAVQQVAQAHPAAGDLLSVCAFLHPDAIPEELFVCGSAHLGQVLGSVVADPYHFDQMLAALRQASLVTRHAERHTFSVHRLVQAVLQDTLEPTAAQRWRERVGQMLAAAFPVITPGTWSQCDRLLPHVLSCAAGFAGQAGNRDVVRLFYHAGDYLYQRGHLDQAEPLFQLALHLQEQLPAPDQEQLAMVQMKLARLWRSQGKYGEAEALYQQALTRSEHVLGADHPEVARLLSALGSLYTEQGRYEQAQPLFEQAVALWRRLSAAEDPEMASALNGLAALLQHQGKPEQATPLFQDALRLRERAFGLDHHEVAAVMSNLAANYQERKQYDQAEQLLQRALSIWEHQEGLTHPDAGYVLDNLSALYLKQQRYERAQVFAQRALDLWEHTLGPDHALVAYPLHTLAEIARTQCQQEQAEALLKRALQIRERCLAPTHPDTASVLMSLATLYREQGRFSLAAPLYQRALSIREQQLGPAHPDTVAARCASQEAVERQSATRRISKPEPPEQTRVPSVNRLLVAAFPAARQQEDQFHSFVSDCCKLTPSAVSLSSDLWQAYRSWVAHHRVPRLLSRRAFAHHLAAVGCQAERTNTVRRWCGIAVALRNA